MNDPKTLSMYMVDKGAYMFDPRQKKELESMAPLMYITLKEVFEECTDNTAGSDDPKFYAPSLDLLARIVDIINRIK